MYHLKSLAISSENHLVVISFPQTCVRAARWSRNSLRDSLWKSNPFGPGDGGTSPPAWFPAAQTAAAQRTEHRWTPGARGRPEVSRGFCSFPRSSEPLSSSSPYPRSQCAAGLPPLRGNIFTFLPSFSRPCYIRKIPAAQGKEAEGRKNSECMTQTPPHF